MRHGRSGTVVGQLGWWVGHFGSDAATVTPVYTYDAESLEELLREWEVEELPNPPIRVTYGSRTAPSSTNTRRPDWASIKRAPWCFSSQPSPTLTAIH